MAYPCGKVAEPDRSLAWQALPGSFAFGGSCLESPGAFFRQAEDAPLMAGHVVM